MYVNGHYLLLGYAADVVASNADRWRTYTGDAVNCNPGNKTGQAQISQLSMMGDVNRY